MLERAFRRLEKALQTERALLGPNGHLKVIDEPPDAIMDPLKARMIIVKLKDHLKSGSLRAFRRYFRRSFRKALPAL